MERIKVGLASLAPMLSDLVNGIVAGQPDMEVVASFPRCEDWLLGVPALPHILVVGISNTELPAACEKVLKEHPQLCVVGVTGNGRRAFLYELRPQRVPLGELSPQELVDAIRAAVLGGTSMVRGASTEEG